MTEIYDNNYKIKINSNEPIILFFTAEWCYPAKSMENIINKISLEFKNLKYYKIDIDKNPEITKKFSINKIPTTYLYENNKIKNCLIGFYKKEFTIKNILR